ncbi:MAG: class II aldolase/adducin family protein [Proteobacteria bacterium]|nr:class II aldolase/adducin family protein [Pseudomonadota bacterium]MCP4917856.1 class II aldolase/adducin family protein [Pseudomonadota bacterium]
MSEESLRRDVVATSLELHARGWVANHDGNVTTRLGERFLSTPTAVSKSAVSSEMLIVVDDSGSVVQGTRKAFSELKLHLAAYRCRPDVGAVLHAHPPTATGFAVSGVDLGEPFMAEPIVSIGSRIPTVPFGLPGDPELDASLAAALGGADCVLLANHGVLTVGPDLETCLLRMELVEHVAKIALVARQLGGPVAIPSHIVDKLQKKHDGLFPRNAAAPEPTSSSTWQQPTAHTGSASHIVASALKRHT